MSSSGLSRFCRRNDGTDRAIAASKWYVGMFLNCEVGRQNEYADDNDDDDEEDSDDISGLWRRGWGPEIKNTRMCMRC